MHLSIADEAPVCWTPATLLTIWLCEFCSGHTRMLRRQLWMHGFEKRRIVRPLDAHEMDVAAAERDTVGTAGLRSDSACQSLGAKGGFAEEAAQTVQQLRGL